MAENTIIVKAMLMKETVRLLDKKLVIAQRANRAFEGELKKQGDTVSVQTFPNIAFATGGTAGDDITASNFTITSEDLVVDQVAQVNVAIKDWEELRSNLDLQSKVANRLAYALADLYDLYVANKAILGAQTAIATVALSASNVYAEIEKMRVALSALNAFQDAALFVLPGAASFIRQSTLFDGYREGTEVRQEAYVGRMSGFKIYETNNLPTGMMLAFDRDSVHFVEQMNKMKITDAPLGFRKNVLVEALYGAKVFTENKKRIVKHPYS